VIGNLSNSFEDAKGTEELERQLVVGASSNKRLYVRLELKEYPITNTEGTLSAMFVSLPFHTVLSATKVLLNQSHHEVSIGHPLMEFRNQCCYRNIQSQMSWWKPI